MNAPARELFGRLQVPVDEFEARHEAGPEAAEAIAEALGALLFVMTASGKNKVQLARILHYRDVEENWVRRRVVAGFEGDAATVPSTREMAQARLRAVNAFDGTDAGLDEGFTP